MKRLFFLIFTCLLAIPFFNGCSDDDGTGPCNAPIADYAFPQTASTWLLKPFAPKDTIRFKVYYRANRSSNYIYRRDENFIVKDTMLKKIQVANTYSSSINCNDYMTVHYMVANISGPESLTCQLTDQSVFEIALRGMAFNKGADLFHSHQNEWDDSLYIGGHEYYSITLCKGLSSGNPPYTDSTYMFYNQQYGLLKFIINDTLIYQRQLH